MHLISDTQARKYAEHFNNLRKPLSPSRWQTRIEALAEQHQARNVLDYGCGRQRLSKYSNLRVVNYDPAIEAYSRLPEPADLVVCIHVLEHVEVDCIDSVIEHIESLALKCALIAVSCEEGSERFPDGENLHCFVRSYEWWRDRLSHWTEIKPVLSGGREYAATLCPG